MLKEFFENRDIFLTGGSGVVGKALIEKLLRSTNVRKIYVLLRPKANVSIEERLENLKMATIFRTLKLQKPGAMDEKLVAIPGDATIPLLGIASEYVKLLENVSIIFHCAATIRFDEPLRDAIKLNVGGTLEALKFAETLKHLEVFMHVSTFFSNPYLKFVEEKLYDSPMDWKFCLSLVDNKDIPDAVLDSITRKLIIGFPNTYCFTKNLAESLVNDYRGRLPVAIYRPSIVLFALEEPEPGFSPTLMGAMGLFAVTGAGIMKIIYMGKNIRLDLTPQDIGIKTLCYYTFKTAQFYKEQYKEKEVPIYNMSSCTHTFLTFPEYINLMQDHGFWAEAAFEKNFLIPGLQVTDNRLVYMFRLFLQQLLPALLTDLFLAVSGRKPALLSSHRKIYCTIETLKPFLFNTYESKGITDVDEMVAVLHGTDFNLDIVPLLGRYYKNVEFCQPVPYSVREHLLKEDPKTLPRSRKILQVKFCIYNVMKFLFAFKIYESVFDTIGNLC